MAIVKKWVLVLILATVLSVCTRTKAEDLEVTNDSNESGGNYSSKVTESEKEKDIEILDNEGNLVTTILVFDDEGYEIEKPEDREVCLVKDINENSTCFEETPVTKVLPESIWEKCTGREVLIMEPAECKEELDLNEESEVSEHESESAGRKKRAIISTCCRWSRSLSVYCKWTTCCRWSWLGRCTRRCCLSYGLRITWSSKCIRGYTRKYWF